MFKVYRKEIDFAGKTLTLGNRQNRPSGRWLCYCHNWRDKCFMCRNRIKIYYVKVKISSRFPFIIRKKHMRPVKFQVAFSNVKRVHLKKKH